MTTTSVPGPWVDHESASAAPWRTRDGIVKFIEFPVRKAAMSRRAFHLYWQRHHSPHVMNATGFSQYMRKYMTAHVCSHEAPELPGHLRSEPRFEGAGEVWINSLDDATAWLGHPTYSELIAPDEANFIDANGRGEVLVVREERLHDEDRDLAESGLIKLYVTAKRRHGLGRDAFHESVSESTRAVLLRPSLRGLLKRFTLSHRLPDPYPDWLPPTETDVVFELWFDGRDALRRFFADESGGSTFPLVEGVALEASSLRAIVTRLHVVHDEFSFQPTTMQPVTFRWNE